MKNLPPLALTPPKRVSLVAQTIQSLRSALIAGYWRETMPGERELCQTLEVSRPTLRAALAELQREGDLKSTARNRRRILTKATRLHPTGRTVAVISSSPLRRLNPGVVLMIDALRDHLARSGWTMQIHVRPSCFTLHPDRALRELTARAPAATWLLIGSVQSTQQWFARSSLHCLVVGTCEAGIMLPSVDADHHATARHAGALFLRKGHRRIVLVRSDANTGGDSETERGLREVLASSPSATLHVLRHRSRDHLLALLDQTLRADSPPTAFFVLRPAHALTVTMHLLRRGRSIPKDAAVIGRDDEDYLAHTSPVITRYGGVGERLARDISRLVRTVAETRTLNLCAVRLVPKFIAGETV